MELIFHRTAADVAAGNELGTYGHRDLNRVEGAVAAIAALCPALDIPLALQVKTDWAPPGAFSPASWPTQSQLQRYLHNVKALAEGLAPHAALPATMAGLDWQGANAIEAALAAAHSRAVAVLGAFRHSGEFFAGEETMI